jgi:hypothetical protein
VSNQVEIIYSSGRNSKETGEIIRISPRKSARGIRPLSIQAANILQALVVFLQSPEKQKPRQSITGFRRNSIRQQ